MISLEYVRRMTRYNRAMNEQLYDCSARLPDAERKEDVRAFFKTPMAFAVTHFFNHQTHHRGQVTTLLFQRGIDPGVTDFLWLAEKS